MISKKEFTKLHSKIATYIKRTPIMRSRLLNGLAETEVYFKCENFQRMGAFKMRGATAAILELSAEERAKGVVTHSSGNFAQAVSL
ncbi:MAG TPA: pyridoxal-phosphate dependent enzyme, partial [Salegentibacter sp.]|nr:pyridoxal-phosphate dependent enzyme [Salegentibacter sp.]